MISGFSDWRGLLDALRAREPWLAQVPSSVACAVLAGPCAVALWIARRAQELAARPSLSILIVGAEATDVPDEARWYQLLPALLDANFATQVTLVGLELDPSFASSAAAHAPEQTARAYRQSLAQFLDENGSAPIDLAFVFHPGLQKHRGWLERDGFPALLARRVPLVCAAYELDEYEMERWIVEAYGYRVSGAPLLNPFFLDLSDERTAIRWGRVLWEIEGPPEAGADVDRGRLARLDTLNRMVLHSMAANASGPAYGAPVELMSSDGVAIKLVHVFDHRYLDMRTGDLVVLEQGVLRPVKQLPPEAKAAYPGDTGREIERAMWAAGIKERYLLETYPQSPQRDHSEVTARMFAALRRKAAALFKGGR